MIMLTLLFIVTLAAFTVSSMTCNVCVLGGVFCESMTFFKMKHWTL